VAQDVGYEFKPQYQKKKKSKGKKHKTVWFMVNSMFTLSHDSAGKHGTIVILLKRV
jgi:hypothetical protein